MQLGVGKSDVHVSVTMSLAPITSSHAVPSVIASPFIAPFGPLLNANVHSAYESSGSDCIAPPNLSTNNHVFALCLGPPHQ